MKLAAILLLILLPGLLFAQAPQSFRTLHMTATNGFSIQTKFFDATEGSRLMASVSCNFVDHPCLAGPPVYWDGVHAGHFCYFKEIVPLRQINMALGTQEQFFVLTVKPLAAKQIQVIAPGNLLSANYILLVQEDTGIDTK
jgi:hypothetical protein